MESEFGDQQQKEYEYAAQTWTPAAQPKSPTAQTPTVTAPKVRVIRPKLQAETPKAHVKEPKAYAEAPKVPAEAPKVPAEAPKAPTSAPISQPPSWPTSWAKATKFPEPAVAPPLPIPKMFKPPRIKDDPPSLAKLRRTTFALTCASPTPPPPIHEDLHPSLPMYPSMHTRTSGGGALGSVHPASLQTLSAREATRLLLAATRAGSPDSELGFEATQTGAHYMHGQTVSGNRSTGGLDDVSHHVQIVIGNSGAGGLHEGLHGGGGGTSAGDARGVAPGPLGIHYVPTLSAGGGDGLSLDDGIQPSTIQPTSVGGSIGGEWRRRDGQHEVVSTSSPSLSRECSPYRHSRAGWVPHLEAEEDEETLQGPQHLAGDFCDGDGSGWRAGGFFSGSVVAGEAVGGGGGAFGDSRRRERQDEEGRDFTSSPLELSLFAQGVTPISLPGGERAAALPSYCGVERPQTAPIGHSPIDHSPIGHSPTGHFPTGHSPIGHSHIGHSPIDHFPIGQAPGPPRPVGEDHVEEQGEDDSVYGVHYGHTVRGGQDLAAGGQDTSRSCVSGSYSGYSLKSGHGVRSRHVDTGGPGLAEQLSPAVLAAAMKHAVRRPGAAGPRFVAVPAYSNPRQARGAALSKAALEGVTTVVAASLGVGIDASGVAARAEDRSVRAAAAAARAADPTAGVAGTATPAGAINALADDMGFPRGGFLTRSSGGGASGAVNVVPHARAAHRRLQSARAAASAATTAAGAAAWYVPDPKPGEEGYGYGTGSTHRDSGGDGDGEYDEGDGCGFERDDEPGVALLPSPTPALASSPSLITASETPFSTLASSALASRLLSRSSPPLPRGYSPPRTGSCSPLNPRSSPPQAGTLTPGSCHSIGAGDAEHAAAAASPTLEEPHWVMHFERRNSARVSVSTKRSNYNGGGRGGGGGVDNGDSTIPVALERMTDPSGEVYITHDVGNTSDPCNGTRDITDDVDGDTGAAMTDSVGIRGRPPSTRQHASCSARTSSGSLTRAVTGPALDAATVTDSDGCVTGTGEQSAAAVVTTGEALNTGGGGGGGEGHAGVHHAHAVGRGSVSEGGGGSIIRVVVQVGVDHAFSQAVREGAVHGGTRGVAGWEEGEVKEAGTSGRGEETKVLPKS